MKPFGKILQWFALGLLIQGGIYYYLDQVYLVPASDYEVSGQGQEKQDLSEQFPSVLNKEGTVYYSARKSYMAVVDKESVKIYPAGKANEVQNVNLRGMQISFFEWLPDRELAIMGMYKENGTVVLAQYNPDNPEHEINTEISDLPSGSKIVDVAYSTATNVVYMKIQVAENAYRVYRTDANYDTRRVYMQASDIGRLGIFYDEDAFFYDNVKTGDVYVFYGVEGSWRVINPAGRYRLIGVDSSKNIYVANVDKDDKVLSVSEGRLGVGFTKVLDYPDKPTLNGITIESVKQKIAESNATGSAKKQ